MYFLPFNGNMVVTGVVKVTMEVKLEKKNGQENIFVTFLDDITNTGKLENKLVNFCEKKGYEIHCLDNDKGYGKILSGFRLELRSRFVDKSIEREQDCMLRSFVKTIALPDNFVFHLSKNAVTFNESLEQITNEIADYLTNTVFEDIYTNAKKIHLTSMQSMLTYEREVNR